MRSQFAIQPAALAAPASLAWPRWPLLLVLWVLFLGPPVAALFIAIGLPLMTDLGWLARDLLSTYVCPTPAKSYALFGAPMAVCARCWGATLGLWVGYGLLRHAVALQARRWAGLAWLLALPWLLRLTLVIIPFALWVAEIAIWPGAPYWVLLLNGLQAGIGAGIFFCSIWPGMSGPHMRQPHILVAS